MKKLSNKLNKLFHIFDSPFYIEVVKQDGEKGFVAAIERKKIKRKF